MATSTSWSAQAPAVDLLLLEAGDDQGSNLNRQVPAFHFRSTEDEKMCWDYFVKHYADETLAHKDSKMTWETPAGTLNVGFNPPSGSKPKGILLITIYPHESDWSTIANNTGDIRETQRICASTSAA